MVNNHFGLSKQMKGHLFFKEVKSITIIFVVPVEKADSKYTLFLLCLIKMWL